MSNNGIRDNYSFVPLTFYGISGLLDVLLNVKIMVLFV